MRGAEQLIKMIRDPLTRWRREQAIFDVWVLRHWFSCRTVPLILHFLYLKVVLITDHQMAVEGGPDSSAA